MSDITLARIEKACGCGCHDAMPEAWCGVCTDLHDLARTLLRERDEARACVKRQGEAFINDVRILTAKSDTLRVENEALRKAGKSDHEKYCDEEQCNCEPPRAS